MRVNLPKAMKENKQSWEERFDKKFKDYWRGTALADEIKFFIRILQAEAWKEEREALRKMVEAKKPILWNDNQIRHAENVAVYNVLDELIKSL